MYMVNNNFKALNTYSSYQEAFDKAVDYAKVIKKRSHLSDDVKNSMIKSICVIDTIGNDDVTTSELKHILLKLCKE